MYAIEMILEYRQSGVLAFYRVEQTDFEAYTLYCFRYHNRYHTICIQKDGKSGSIKANAGKEKTFTIVDG